MNSSLTYDAAITGGGLAGLSAAILLADKGYKVVLFEKETYPFHKVCGEYISMESWDFVHGLGLNPEKFRVSIIDRLEVSAPNGKMLTHSLTPGGFGISRYLIDDELKKIAEQKGVTVLQETKVNDIVFSGEDFNIITSNGEFTAKACAGAFGKRSNLDVKWKRKFTLFEKGKLQQFIGIKYHIKYPQPPPLISLHNFQDGYCGISNIEDGKCCLCYLTTAANLKKSGNSIEKMEAEILCKNPHLARIFSTAEKIYAAPLAISQISFLPKTQIENHVLMIGDAAGLITPLCGNGMSMAMHGAKIAAGFIHQYLAGEISRDMMETKYQQSWKAAFDSRLNAGRIIQRFFGNSQVTNLFIGFMKRLPRLTRLLISKTHGQPF